MMKKRRRKREKKEKLIKAKVDSNFMVPTNSHPRASSSWREGSSRSATLKDRRPLVTANDFAVSAVSITAQSNYPLEESPSRSEQSIYPDWYMHREHIPSVQRYKKKAYTDKGQPRLSYSLAEESGSRKAGAIIKDDLVTTKYLHVQSKLKEDPYAFAYGHPPPLAPGEKPEQVSPKRIQKHKNAEASESEYEEQSSDAGEDAPEALELKMNQSLKALQVAKEKQRLREHSNRISKASAKQAVQALRKSQERELALLQDHQRKLSKNSKVREPSTNTRQDHIEAWKAGGSGVGGAVVSQKELQRSIEHAHGKTPLAFADLTPFANRDPAHAYYAPSSSAESSQSVLNSVEAFLNNQRMTTLFPPESGQVHNFLGNGDISGHSSNHSRIGSEAFALHSDLKDLELEERLRKFEERYGKKV